jgi:cyclic beta-1,2-glucan synthetase
MNFPYRNVLAQRHLEEGASAWTEDRPIRAEVFGEDRLREHAASLARHHSLTQRGASHRLVLGRLKTNGLLLRDAHDTLLAADAAGGVITPAAEWLVDNFHVAEQHIQQAVEDLPSAYYRQLPKLAEGHLKSYPRVMAIAWAYIAHTDSHFSDRTLVDFVNAYQAVKPLSIGELWAIAIHIRILLIENAARVARRTVESRDARAIADDLATKLAHQRVSFHDVDVARMALPEHARISFFVHLIRRLRSEAPVEATSVAQFQLLIQETGLDAESAAHEEHARQVANNVTMQNIFTSLKRIAEQDWEDWFEQVSEVDRLLAGAPTYRGLDGASRTSYRRAIEDLARHSGWSETDIAGQAIIDCMGDDPGLMLIGGRRQELERKISYRAPFGRRARRWVRRLGAPGYVQAIMVVSLVIVAIGLRTAAGSLTGPMMTVALALVLLAPAFDAAMAMVNFATTQLMRPIVLPRLALDGGIPPEHRALIAVPVLITSFHGIEESLERLEGHYLTNDDPNLAYALLSDFADSAEERRPSDEGLLGAVEEGIAALNRRHGHQRFMLFHRSRRWNAQENVWMGWERKRGKLHELNRLLRGARDTSFIRHPDPLPEGVRYIIVLDADTILPRGAARRLVGNMAHPLNRPSFDPRRGRVTNGYGILQPRVTIALPALGRGSLYQQIFSARPGIDPYVFATSDVYQDLFGEGSFTGKGIYEIDSFEAAVANRIPDNTLLSHDLFEGNFARAGLVSDVQVVEDFPERYVVDMARHHRWARGDWQLLAWMFPPAAGLTGLGFWKMLDNLRRSLTPALTLLALVTGWLALPGEAAAAWTFFLGAVLFVPSFLPIFAGSSLRREPITLESQILTILDDIGHALMLWGAKLVLLAHQSAVMLDAIGRSLYRLTVSRHNMLEWTTAAQQQARLNPTLAGTYTMMAWSPAAGLAVALAGLVPELAPQAIAYPFALAWLVAPAFAYWISRPPKLRGDHVEDAAALRELRKIALVTWRYFDAHVTPEDNNLPPDNFQEDPTPQLARRTSPTNIGLYLLSTVSACEMGWIGADEAAGRMQATLAAVARMETYRGHLFNWYDTETLRPLEPRYVSSVDSGNFAAHLIAVANACEAWQQSAIYDSERLGGLIDVIRILDEIVAETGRSQRSADAPSRQAGAMLRALAEAIVNVQRTPELVPLRTINMGVHINAVEQALRRLWEKASYSGSRDGLYWVDRLRRAGDAVIRETTREPSEATRLNNQLAAIAATCRALAYGTDFSFLENRQRHLLSVGYRMVDESLDESCYDLLASEAALTCFLAIGKGDVSERLWARLGRPIAAVERAACLVSWSGSMFEYLMPLLVLTSHAETLYGQTMRLVVRRQMSYAAARGTPWGISESAYAVRDRQFTYQYSNFGVPGLGLKRGLADNLVIAPYATGLAAMVTPGEAAQNYRRIAAIGGSGRFGFYEAIDFTPDRLRLGQTSEVIRAYFAHHQGMTVTAIHNAISGGALRAHFSRENIVRASDLLLQERAPNHLPVKISGMGAERTVASAQKAIVAASRHVDPRSQTEPVTHLLSNGRYTLMLTAAGTGYSRWNGIAINRWREDPTCDGDGMAILLRDSDKGTLWPATPGHRSSEASRALAIFNEEKAEYHRVDDGITTHVECIVSTEDDAEARAMQLVNTSDRARRVEYTTYMELALAQPAADDAHPAFSKLFVETEFIAEFGALIATRRRRSDSDAEIWVAQFIVSDNDTVSQVEYETSRQAFLGRGNAITVAPAFARGHHLSGTTGHVLDPIFALRQSVTLQPHRKTRAVVWTVAAASRGELLEKVSRHRSISVFERVQVLAWTQARILLRHLSIDASEANLFQQLAAALIYSSQRHRPQPDKIAAGMALQSTLWPLAISGNRPIVAVHISESDDLPVVEQVLRAHDYWQEKRLPVDIVIVNGRRTSYMQDLQGRLEALVARERISRSLNSAGEPGEIFLVRSDLTTPATLAALDAAARVVLDAARGKLEDQLARPPGRPAAAGTESLQPLRPVVDGPRAPPEGLQFFNGFGGFSADGREYVIAHDGRRPLPAPWINVIANPTFGTHVSAEGGGYTWFVNSRERQITAWSNDAVSDRPSEVFYVRDRDDGSLSSPTVLPLGRRAGTFTTRHGFGYSVHEGEEAGLAMELVQTVAPADPVKRVRLRISNRTGKARRLQVTFHAETVMGQRRAAAAHFVTSDYDGTAEALFLRNLWSSDFGAAVVFADFSGAQTNWTANRRAVLGQGGGLDWPQGIQSGAPLSMEAGGGFDPCISLQTMVDLAAGESRHLVLNLGAAGSAEEARRLVASYRETAFDDTLADTRRQWQDLLGAITVKTPDPSFDLMMNGWLLYQTIACRMWARSGFYQASGAFGFRDQLQDSMALAQVRPDLMRQHLLAAAARQFEAGDVQHWWLAESGAGVRTRISDDTVWLAYCTAYYVGLTGDATILDEPVSFLEARELEEGEHDLFLVPASTAKTASLYEHCVMALARNQATGTHGLPLMGTGDWNDGMNKVGAAGRGESVWLGWFLCATLVAFEKLAKARKDTANARAWGERRRSLARALDQKGWDGAWYVRAYFDDGSPLGTHQDSECKIDAIVQSWAVLSGAADPDKARTAMESLERHLIDREHAVARLFWPPLRRHVPDAGYIQSYPPGIRENGGQYSHGAIWAIFALAELGESEKAWEFFQLINPVNHGRDEESARRYGLEPYVMAGDVYSVAPHAGRGGWSWYTGSAGWLYRAGLEAMLGLRRKGSKLTVRPRVPASWATFEVDYQFGGKSVVLVFRRGAAGAAVGEIDLGAAANGTRFEIPLA